MSSLLVRSLLSLSLLLGIVPVSSPLSPPRARAQTVLPDLVPTDLTASPASPRWDDPITVSWTVENRGADPGGGRASWFDALHLSTDRTLDSYDRDLGIFPAPGPVAAGGRYAGSERVDLPIVPTGTYYLILAADRSDDLAEGDEGNNVVVSPAIDIAGLDTDLVPTDVSADAETATPGESFTVAWSVANRGADAVPATEPGGSDVIWFHKLYLSRDDRFDEGDRLLSLRRASAGTVEGPLASGDRYTITAEVMVPVVPTGTYTLLIMVDWHNFLWESDEANNVLAGPRIAITGLDVDLAPVELTASTVEARWYQRVTVAWTVANPGADAIPPRGGDPRVWHGSDIVWYDELYLSADETLDGGDWGLQFVIQEGPVESGGRYTTTVEVTMPVVPDGTYHLLVVIDSSRHLTERDEANNTFVGPVIAIAGVDVDLVPAALTPSPSTGAPDEEIEFRWTVVNRGTDAIPDGAVWYDQVYLSADQTLDEGDTLLQSYGGWAVPPSGGQGPVAAGGSYDATLRVTLPAGTGTGGYLIVAVDAGDALRESDETNNVLAVPFVLEAMR